MTPTHRRIVLRLYSELERLGATSDLLAMIGSWGDTMEDEEVLKALVERGRKEEGDELAAD